MSCSKQGGFKKGVWSTEEDEILTNYVNIHGEGKWRKVVQNAGLKRYPKSCRLRWLNYLKPGIKRGYITIDEEDLIIRLHRLLGNRWSLIAGRIPGRTDNEIKNYWNTYLVKKLNRAHYSSRTSNNNTRILISEEETHKTLADDNHALVSNPETVVSDLALLSVSPKQGEELEANKVISDNVDEADGLIFLSSENNANFVADVGDTGCDFPSNLVAPDGLENVVYSSPWDSMGLEHYAKLLDVEMINYSAVGEPMKLDIELKKLASFLDLEEE